MAGTITPNLTDINLCDVDDWDGGVGALDIESQIQGSGCLSITYTGAGLRAETTETISTINLITLGYPIIYGWLTFARLAMLDTYNNGGLRFIVKSSSTAWSAWKVAGSNTASTAGWACYAIRTNQPPDYIGTTAADMTNITQIGWIVNLAIKGVVKWDAFRYGTGLTMTAGTSGAPCTIDDIWTNENDVNKKYGVVTNYEGVYFVQGRLRFGDTESGNTYFKDTSEILVFKDARVDAASVTTSSRARASNVATIVTASVHILAAGDGVRISGLGGTGYNGNFVVASTPSTTSFTYANTGGDEGTTGDTGGTVVGVGFYEVKLQGGSGSTEVYFGSRLGDGSEGSPYMGISGCTFKSSGAAKFKITATASEVTKFGFYGCNFLDADVVSLPAVNSADKQVLNCNFEGCARAVVSICIVKNCNFVSADADAILISSINHNTTYCNFIACPEGVKLDTYNASAYPFSGLIFTNTTYHVNNTSGSTLTVGNSNGSNASTYTGTLVNFTGSVVLTMTVKNEAGQVIVGAWAYIDPTDESPFIMNKITNESGVASETYTGAPVNNTRWRVRKYGYKNFRQLIDIAGSNISLPVTLVIDPQQT